MSVQRRTFGKVREGNDFEYDAAGTPVVPDDPVLQTNTFEVRMRERQIAVEQTRIIQDKLRHCYQKEGVNHYEVCKPLVDAYVARISSPDYHSLKGSDAAKHPIG